VSALLIAIDLAVIVAISSSLGANDTSTAGLGVLVIPFVLVGLLVLLVAVWFVAFVWWAFKKSADAQRRANEAE
jgi:fatty acid desaturase